MHSAEPQTQKSLHSTSQRQWAKPETRVSNEWPLQDYQSQNVVFNEDPNESISWVSQVPPEKQRTKDLDPPKQPAPRFTQEPETLDYDDRPIVSKHTFTETPASPQERPLDIDDIEIPAARNKVQTFEELLALNLQNEDAIAPREQAVYLDDSDDGKPKRTFLKRKSTA